MAYDMTMLVQALFDNSIKEVRCISRIEILPRIIDDVHLVIVMVT